jgi:hypothetical protein
MTCRWTLCDETGIVFCGQPVSDEEWETLCAEHAALYAEQGANECGLCGELFAGEYCPNCWGELRAAQTDVPVATRVS